MPTPVGVARQCLAETAAAVLDDAVAVAKRRSHAQTTSLHAVSALLALPASALREACSRARSSAYSPRLQFRALDLCVGVALDRISVSKSSSTSSSSADEPPPVSNSLMAAIKRSQANQRRHPETFHLYQQLANSPNSSSISAVKVELKHFVMSILDDPIVSRVFDDAGFRTHDLKLAIINPISVSRFSSSPASRPPPLFFCSVRDFELDKHYPTFPFPDPSNHKIDDNSRRIAEILLATTRSRRNPLLIGACASDAYRKFIDSLKTGDQTESLPREIHGLKLASVEQEISDFITGKSTTEDSIKLKLQEIDEAVEDSLGPGTVLTCGDMKGFTGATSATAVNGIVAGMKKLLTKHSAKVWLLGFLGSDDDYNKMVNQFPSIEKDWDLHLLPITTSTAGKSFKSSLMKSFVPFGGFFPMPSELESPSSASQSSKLCKLCNEKCEQELNVILKGWQPSTDSVPDNPSPRLQITECEASQKSDTVKAKEDKALLDARVLGLRRKWSDICRRLHSSWKSQGNINHTVPHASTLPSFRSVPFSDLQKSMPIDCTSSSSVLSVTTDLRLGTFVDSSIGIRVPHFQEHRNSESTGSQGKPSSRTSQSPLRSSYSLEKSTCIKDLEHPWKVLAEKVYWQVEAIQTISRTISRHSSKRVWLSFLGPDKVGKRKIAASLAETVFGGNEHFLRVDLNAQDTSSGVNSIVDSYDSEYNSVKSGRKLIVNYLAEKLRKHPHSVVLLESVESADSMVRESLARAIKTGKFPDSYGRDISVTTNIFVLASSIRSSKDISEFPEGNILEAKDLQMQISVDSRERINQTDHSSSSRNVLVSPRSHAGKRKSVHTESSETSKRSCCFPRSVVIDLNVPVEEDDDTSEDIQDSSADNSETWLEELLEHVDESVVFKPFDFDSLYRQILKEIDVRLRGKVVLEIHHDVMVQILAAAWVSNGENALEDWIENVLCATIEKACEVHDGSVMKLMPSDGAPGGEWDPGIRLPRRINVK